MQAQIGVLHLKSITRRKTMDSVSRALLMTGGESGPAQGQIVYDGPTDGTASTSFSFVVPSGVTSVSVVCVTAGFNGNGAGGHLAYGNNITVTPGETLTAVASGGNRTEGSGRASSQLKRGGTVLVSSGTSPSGANDNSGTNLSGGGVGGPNQGGNAGAGAAGYTGQGGANTTDQTGTAGSGGGGGSGGNRDNKVSYSGGYTYFWANGAGGGGGVGLLGQGSNGAGGTFESGGGGGGSGGGSGGGGGSSSPGGAAGNGGNGGLYGGGGGLGGYSEIYIGDDYISGNSGANGIGARGAVRIIWPGNTRQFPSTNTGNV